VDPATYRVKRVTLPCSDPLSALGGPLNPRGSDCSTDGPSLFVFESESTDQEATGTRLGHDIGRDGIEPELCPTGRREHIRPVDDAPRDVDEPLPGLAVDLEAPQVIVRWW